MKVHTLGIDQAKNVFQLLGVDHKRGRPQARTGHLDRADQWRILSRRGVRKTRLLEGLENG